MKIMNIEMSDEDLARRLVALKDIAEKDQIIENYLQIADLPRSLEFVRDSKRQKAYYRRRPRTRDNPGPGQAAHRLKFALVAAKTYDKKGVVTLPDGRKISKGAYLVGIKLKNTQEGPDPEKEVLKLTKLLTDAPERRKVISTPWR